MKNIFFIFITLFLCMNITSESNIENQEIPDIFQKFFSIIFNENHSDLDKSWLIQNKKIVLEELNNQCIATDKLIELANAKSINLSAKKIVHDLIFGGFHGGILGGIGLTTIGGLLLLGISDDKNKDVKNIALMGIGTFSFMGLSLMAINLEFLKRIWSLEQSKNHAKVDNSGIIGHIKFAQQHKRALDIIIQFVKSLPDNDMPKIQEEVIAS